MPPLVALLTTFAVGQTGGEVAIPLSTWLGVEREIAALKEAQPPPVSFAVRRRDVSIRFVRGVLFGVLEQEVETMATGAVVPLLDRDASLRSLTIDGRPAVPLRNGPYYEALLAGAGVHRITVRFRLGEEQARFARAFTVRLPPAAISRAELLLPERDVDVSVEGGVVVAERSEGEGTKVVASFGTPSDLNVRWRRRATHDGRRVREMEAVELHLARMLPEVVQTESVLTYTLVSGETDRLEAFIPDGVEVTRVDGEAILQWYTERRDQRRLVVLLKHLVDDRAQIVVHAQAPLTTADTAALRFVGPAQAASRDVWLAVEGRAGFALDIAEAEEGVAVQPREVPPALANLTNQPILYAYRGRGRCPKLTLSRTRNGEIDLTQAVIDDLWASTVIVEQGLEVTKLRLYVRNNTRQYLAMRLPAGAAVTHAMIDGVPFLPAVTGEGDAERLLVPLRQSERIVGGKRSHVVRSGDTLGGLSLRYFGRSDRWQAIIDANDYLYGPDDLGVGTTITIPSTAGDVTFEESNFVVEIAYKVPRAPLVDAGLMRTELPVMDLSVMSATWHYYFPEAFEPLRFDSNLQQLTGIRYDPLRRLKQFFDRAVDVQHAWAGSHYENILETRKSIYAKEQKTRVTEALAAFPLVGQRYRFERVVLEHERAYLEVAYLDRGILPWIRGAAFLLFLGVAFSLARVVRSEGPVRALFSGASLTFFSSIAVAAVVGHFVLGVHRHALLGADLGIALVVLPPLARRLRARVSEAVRTRTVPIEAWWRPRRILKIGLAAVAITVLLTYPLLLSSAVLVALLVALVSSAREGSHAH